MFVPTKPLQPRLMFVGKVRCLPQWCELHINADRAAMAAYAAMAASAASAAMTAMLL